jgi:hypothetical protein
VECAGKAVAATALSIRRNGTRHPVAPLLPRRCRRSRSATAVHVCGNWFAGHCGAPDIPTVCRLGNQRHSDERSHG